MKITLSKFKRGEKRHIVLVCDAVEAEEIHMIIYNDVLEREVYPRRERMRSGTVRYRFAMKYLDPLMMTFPYAEFSPALDSRLSARAAEELQAMPVPDLDLDGFTGELRDYQKIAVGRMIGKKRFGLHDDLGLGKGVMALAAIVGGQRFPALAIVPNGPKFNWLREGERFTDATISVVDGTAAQRRAAIQTEADITIVNTEALRVKSWTDDEVCQDTHCSMWQDESVPQERRMHNHTWYEFKNPGLFFEDDSQSVVRDIDLPDMDWLEWNVAVVDEYHRFKNPLAQQTIGLHMIHSTRKWAMSGTPVLNGRPEEYWSILHWLWPKKFPSFYQFEKEHCVKKGSRVIAYRGLTELRDFLNVRTLRRRKDQVLSDLPEVVYVDDYIDLTPEQRRLYNEILERMRIWINEEPRRLVNVLSQITRLKQACFSPELYEGSAHSAKLDRLKELVRELTREGHKAIVFSQWSKATRIIERELSEYNPAYIDGTVPARDRMAEVDKFNNDETCQLFIGTIGACREGFTLSAATYVIFTDEGWVPAEMMQAAGRSAAGGLRGEGVGGSVHIITLRANETIEDDIQVLLRRKQQMNNRLTERDSGARVERIEMDDIRTLLGLNPAEEDAA